MIMSVTDFFHVIEMFLNEYQNHKDEITKLDSELGDGDHWVNLNSGFEMVVSNKKKYIILPAKDFYKKIGKTLMQGIGGSSGILFGSAFIAVNDCFDDQDVLDERNFLCFWESFSDSIKKRGQVQYGQKTMLDPIVVAIEAYKNNTTNNFDDKLQSFMQGSRRGLEETKKMEAEKGRGRYHSKKGLGLYDPGAVSMNIFINVFIGEMRTKI